MQKFNVHKGIVVPLDRANVDTDAIIPKQFLKSIKRTGYGENCFDAWRYLDTGQPGMDNSKRPLNPDFVLNQPKYKGASILLTRANVGCVAYRQSCGGRVETGALGHARLKPQMAGAITCRSSWHSDEGSGLTCRCPR